MKEGSSLLGLETKAKDVLAKGKGTVTGDMQVQMKAVDSNYDLL